MCYVNTSTRKKLVHIISYQVTCLNLINTIYKINFYDQLLIIIMINLDINLQN